jgi:hypothetical protein
MIVTFVTERNGCKAMDICASSEIVVNNAQHKIPDLIEELIDEGKLCEIEYVLPTINYRIKSFLLPKDTELVSTKNFETKSDKELYRLPGRKPT